MPLAALAVLLCAYGYCKPYKDTFTNNLQVFLLVALSLLIVFSGNQFMLDRSFQMVNEVFADDCPREELAGITKLSLILLPFYYLPVLVSVGAAVFYALKK